MIFATSLLAAAQGRFAQPGTVNYVEGQVNLDGQSITLQKIGSTLVGPGQVLRTADGKAEMLLTPGVFVRLGAHSAVKMISPSLSDTRVELVEGQTMLEVAAIEKENHIEVAVGGARATIERRGIYEFSANPPMARVFDGKAVVRMDDRSNSVYKGEEVALAAANPKLKTRGFNVKQAQLADDLYAWSKLRADYTAQANMSAAAAAYRGSGPGWYGAGWYWDPYFDQYAFLLADGFLWDPFGFGFFSPWYWGAYAPYLGYGGYGYGHGGFWHGTRPVPGTGGAITRGSAAGAALGAGSGGMRGGFAAVPGGFGRMGGGFGGMHGGGFGGGGRR